MAMRLFNRIAFRASNVVSSGVRTAWDLVANHRHSKRSRPAPSPYTRPCPTPFAQRSIYRCGSLAKKEGMCAIWDQWGVATPVTMLSLNSSYVVCSQQATLNNELNVRVGADTGDASNPVPPERLCQEFNLPSLRKLTSFHVSSNAILESGQRLTASHYTVGSHVDLASTTINKGFQGVVKRWGFKGQPATHGVSKKHRSPGAIGCSRSNGTVFPGKKMAGVMGKDYRFVRNARIMMIDHDENMLFVKAAVPGQVGAFVRIQDTTVKSRAPAGPVPTYLGVPKTGIERLAPEGEDPFLTGLEDNGQDVS